MLPVLERCIQTSELLIAVSRQTVERARLDQRFEHAAIHDAAVDARADISNACERPAFALLDNLAHCTFADIFDGRESEADCVADYREIRAALVHVGG